MTYSDDDLVPLSALQHWAYCPRQCALIHVEQVWDENLFTLRGRRVHEHVDTVGHETRDGIRTEYGLPLFSERLGLVGKADAVEFDSDGNPYPVEHKVGKRSKGRRARHADTLQLCAQGMCLEEMLDREVPSGALSYRSSQRRLDIRFTPELRDEVALLTDKVRQMLERHHLPAPAADERCTRCSLLETCMPFITQHHDNGVDI